MIEEELGAERCVVVSAPNITNHCYKETLAQPAGETKLSLLHLVEMECSIYQQIADSNGEISEDLDLALQLVQLNKADKLDACQYMMDLFAQRAAFLKAKEEEFRASRKTVERVRDRIKGKIKDAMLALGVTEAKGNEYRFKLSTNKEPKISVNEEYLPREYFKSVTTFVPDREKIEKALNLGLRVPGAHFEPVVSLRSYLNTQSLPKKAQS